MSIVTGAPKKEILLMFEPVLPLWFNGRTSSDNGLDDDFGFKSRRGA